MPIYEFHCKECGKDAEILVRRSDWSGTLCPHCGKDCLEKKLSVFAASAGGPEPVAPACSGNPSSCGRCGPE